jgi:hypothetical protein
LEGDGLNNATLKLSLVLMGIHIFKSTCAVEALFYRRVCGQLNGSPSQALNLNCTDACMPALQHGMLTWGPTLMKRDGTNFASEYGKPGP